MPSIHLQEPLLPQPGDAGLQADAILFFDAGQVNAFELAQAEK
jgi:hypothetical protein